MLATGGLGFMFYFPYYLWRKVTRGNRKDKNFQDTYGGIYKNFDYHELTDKNAAFESVITVKKLAIAISLVMFANYPMV